MEGAQGGQWVGTWGKRVDSGGKWSTVAELGVTSGASGAPVVNSASFWGRGGHVSRHARPSFG